MEDLIIEEAEESLAISLKASGELDFTGRSFPEDALEFFAPVMDWLDEYQNSAAEKTVATFSISYFNSTSALHILKLLNALDQIHKAGNDLRVVWHHDENDDLMAEKAEEMKAMVDVPFEISVK